MTEFPTATFQALFKHMFSHSVYKRQAGGVCVCFACAGKTGWAAGPYPQTCSQATQPNKLSSSIHAKGVSGAKTAVSRDETPRDLGQDATPKPSTSERGVGACKGLSSPTSLVWLQKRAFPFALLAITQIPCDPPSGQNRSMVRAFQTCQE